jgi:hypothetical protein
MFDLDIDQNKDIHTDDTNDLAIVRGKARINQSVSISVMDETQDFVGSNLTGTQVALLENAIEDALAADNDVETVTDVSITEFNRDTNTVFADVIVNQTEQFSVEVTA